MDSGAFAHKAVVTGAAGFIGSHLAARLLAQGADVIGIDRLSDYYDPVVKRANLEELQTHPGFTFIEADIAEVATPALLENIQIVYHLAGQPGVRPSWGSSFEIYANDNLMATQALLEAAKEASLDRFVFASSSSVYGDAERFPTRETDTPRPSSPYGVTKLAAEHLCLLYATSYGVPAVALRYFSVYGPRQRPDMAFSRFIQCARDGTPVYVYGDGRQSRDFTFVGDVVAGTLAAAREGGVGEVYNIAGGSTTTVMEVISLLQSLMGAELKVRHAERARGEARSTSGDITKASRELSYVPRYTLEEGLEAQITTPLALSRG